MERREFLKLGVGTVCGFSLGDLAGCASREVDMKNKLPFKISLAEWSFHRRLFGRKGPALDHLDFAKTAHEFGIEAVEYCNPFFMDKARDQSYLGEMKKRANEHGIKSLLIMCDNEGKLGDPDEKQRTQAVENHYKWVEAARFLAAIRSGSTPIPMEHMMNSSSWQPTDCTAWQNSPLPSASMSSWKTTAAFPPMAPG